MVTQQARALEHSLETGLGFAEDRGKEVLPTTPSCLPASLSPPAAAKPWLLLGSARSTGGWGVGDSGLDAQLHWAQVQVLACWGLAV